MPWYGWLMLACVVIGPFDALYLYIKNQKRREKIKKEREERDAARHNEHPQ